MMFRDLKIGDRFKFNTGDAYVDTFIWIKTSIRGYIIAPDGNVPHKVGTIRVKVTKQ